MAGFLLWVFVYYKIKQWFVAGSAWVFLFVCLCCFVVVLLLTALNVTSCMDTELSTECTFSPREFRLSDMLLSLDKNRRVTCSLTHLPPTYSETKSNTEDTEEDKLPLVEKMTK